MNSTPPWHGVLCWFAGALGLGLVAWVGWPGLLSPDSLWQLDQAMKGQFTDSHPPVMAWLWSRLLSVTPGPGGMLLVQNILFWTGDVLLWEELGSRRWAWVGVLATGFLPPVLALLGIVWKDVQMASALLCAVGLLIQVRRGRTRRWRLLLSFLLLAYATAVRFNGFLAAVPLLWLWLLWGFDLSGARLGTALGAVSFALLAFVGVGSRALIHVEDHLSQQYEVHDLAMLSLRAGRSLFPEAYWEGARPLSLEEMGAAYDAIEPSTLFWQPPGHAHFELLTNLKGAERSPRLTALNSAWWRVWLQYPFQLARQRAFLLSHMFGLHAAYTCYDYITEMQSNGLGIKIDRPRAHDGLVRLLAFFRRGLLYRGWLYLSLLVGATAFAHKSRPRLFRQATLGIALSGIGSVLVYPLIGAGCDFRYLWWLMMAALLCLFLAIAGRGVTDAPVV